MGKGDFAERKAEVAPLFYFVGKSEGAADNKTNITFTAYGYVSSFFEISFEESPTPSIHIGIT